MPAMDFDLIWFFTKHFSLFASDFFVCFKLLGEKSFYGVSRACVTSPEPYQWFISPGDQGDFDVCYPITFLLSSPHSLSSSSIVLLHCRYAMQLFSVLSHLWEWALFINIPFNRQYSVIYIYLYVMFFLCQKCPPYYIVHMQMIWSLCCRFYYLFCKWWLICTPTSICPFNQFVVICIMSWIYQMKERVLS